MNAILVFILIHVKVTKDYATIISQVAVSSPRYNFFFGGGGGFFFFQRFWTVAWGQIKRVFDICMPVLKNIIDVEQHFEMGAINKAPTSPNNCPDGVYYSSTWRPPQKQVIIQWGAFGKRSKWAQNIIIYCFELFL